MSLVSRYSDSLRAGRSGDRIPVEARFSAPLQTGPGAISVSCTMGTGSFTGVKRPGRGADNPPLSKCRGHERVGLYLYSPSGPSWPVMGAPLPLCMSLVQTTVGAWPYTGTKRIKIMGAKNSLACGYGRLHKSP